MPAPRWGRANATVFGAEVPNGVAWDAPLRAALAESRAAPYSGGDASSGAAPETPRPIRDIVG